MAENDIKFSYNLESLSCPKKACNSTVIKQNFLYLLNTTYSHSLHIYTDGSRSRSGTGAAYYIPELNITGKFSLDKHFSSYTTELLAILKVTQIFHLIKQQDRPIVIFTDSQAAIQALSKVYNKCSGNGIPVSIIHELLKSDTKVTFQWIPGHTNINYNEYVDNLAKEAVNNGSEVTDIYIPSADFKAHLLKEATAANEQVYQRTEKGKWYKQIQTTSIHNKWYEMTNFKRWEIVNIIRLRFGHARVNSRLFNIKQYFTPLCLSCTRAQQETLDHVILHCPAYEFARNKHFKVIKKLITPTQTVNLIKLLKLEDIEIYKEINNFLVNIKKHI
uniref:RNase H type-1 domain-containing protein n=1 Tax=Homalodisca liturata TaxID=320908 RepID=A0A1B6HT10_9HEMI